MGKTLYESNIEFNKEFIGSFEVKLPEWLKTDFNTLKASSLVFFSKIFLLFLMSLANCEASYFILISLASLKAAPINDMPIGRPTTSPAGTVILA